MPEAPARAARPAAPAPAALRAPASPREMFVLFNRMALQGFGGVIAVAQRELVERAGWMTRAQFLETLSVAQVLPGPNIINMALMIGDRHFGWRGILASVAGLLLAPLVLVLLLAALYGRFAEVPAVAGALRGMGAAAAGLVVATALKLLPTLRGNPLGLPLALVFAAATLATVGVARWPLVGVVLGLGTLSCALAYRRLGRPPAGDAPDGRDGPDRA